MSETSEKIKLSDEEVLQKLKERREKANLAVKKKEEEIKEKNRKERERRIAEIGKIAEDLGILSFDSDTWLGIRDEIATALREIADKAAQWKRNEALNM